MRIFAFHINFASQIQTPINMNTSTISSTPAMTISNETVNIIDLLRVIGMQEVTNNVFTLPKKKKK